MIVVRLQGGIGNQMFQYAAAREVALKNDVPLMLDTRFFESGTLEEHVDSREYGLNVFNIVENIINEDQLISFLKKARKNSKYKLNALNRILFNFSLPIKKIYSERGRQFNPELNYLSTNTYLDGYWQCPKYFEEYHDQIRQDFSFTEQPDVTNQNLINKIKNTHESVAVHVRKGDFDKIDKLGVTPISYYRKAIQKIFERLGELSLYVFGNDLDWAKDQFVEESKRVEMNFIDINSEQSKHANDIRLIAQCRHQIIGNSTFAWWGAWLNSNPDKIIFAPKKIFNDEILNKQIQDMIPREWIRL